MRFFLYNLNFEDNFTLVYLGKAQYGNMVKKSNGSTKATAEMNW